LSSAAGLLLLPGVIRDMSDGPSVSEELALHGQGYGAIAGLDEAGRGSWAGPVVAGAVVLPLSSLSLAKDLAGVRDSKLLTARRREELYGKIVETASAAGVGTVGPARLDELGIVAATRLAMRRALDHLATPPDYLLIDALSLPYRNVPYDAIVRGDDRCLSIAAASIVAKVWRDRTMVALDRVFPGYGFARHKGYGTPQHREALLGLGPCPIHRLSFRPMKLMVDEAAPEEGAGATDGRRVLGRQGEQLAREYLERQGYTVCQMNYRCRSGEVDIVALDGDCLAFVEVRTRSSLSYGSPEESITVAKQHKLIELGETYLQEHSSLPLDWRIDVVCVELSRRGTLRRLELIRDAVRG
jgi:ribonuclease HII